jgi:hypothetical protein
VFSKILFFLYTTRFRHQISRFLLYLNLPITKKATSDLNNEKKNRFLSQNSNQRASNKNAKKITIFKYAFVIFVTCRYYIDIDCALLFLVVLIQGSYNIAGYPGPYSYILGNNAIEPKTNIYKP